MSRLLDWPSPAAPRGGGDAGPAAHGRHGPAPPDLGVGSSPRRLWEIDAARTLAIVMMITYHVVYDLDFLGLESSPDPFRGWWGALPEATASTFLAVAGLSMWVADARHRRRQGVRMAPWRRHLPRTLKVAAAAMLVTITTFAVLPDQFVRFGILHAIALSTTVGILLAPLGRWNALIGAVVLIGGLAIGHRHSDLPFGYVVGLPAESFSSVDYWPMLPWFGVFLLGIGAGSVLYPRGERASALSGLARLDRGDPIIRIMTLPGRRSLAVYLVHQPILLAALGMLLVVAGVDLSWG